MRLERALSWTLLAACSSWMLAAPLPAKACSTFMLHKDGAAYLGESYDFYYGHGMLIANPRNLLKENLRNPGDKRLEWTSRYGSMTLNQFGRELPTAGMNETGLAIALMWNEDGRFAREQGRAGVNELQWIQYQLDTASSVDEVLATVDRLPIHKSHMEIHYSICDAREGCAILEYVDGAPRIRRGAELEPRALTNASYARSLDYYESFRGKPYGEIPREMTPLNFFVRAAALSSSYNASPSGDPIEAAFSILKEVSVRPTFSSLFAVDLLEHASQHLLLEGGLRHPRQSHSLQDPGRQRARAGR